MSQGSDQFNSAFKFFRTICKLKLTKSQRIDLHTWQKIRSLCNRHLGTDVILDMDR